MRNAKLQRAGLLVLIALALGCAGSSITPTTPATSAQIPRPGVLLVYDSAVSANDVVVDTFGHQFQSEESNRSMAEKTAHAVVDSVAEQLVAKLQKRGIHAQRAVDSRVPPQNALLIKGEFVSIKTGSRAKRMAIGFGYGTSKLQVQVRAYQARANGLRRIAAAEVDAHGTRMPGMAVPMAGGAIAGSVARWALISGGMNIAKETSGVMRDDAGRIAEEIASRAQAFYERQGWLGL